MIPEKEPGSADGTQALRAVCSTFSPTILDYSKLVSDLNDSKFVGEVSVFEFGPHVPITHMDFFKPFAVLMELKAMDQRLNKEWKYINGSSVWI